MKYWKCMVCGYIHEGEEPPDVCPVCGAAKDKFEELGPEEGKKAKEEYDAKMGGGDKTRAAAGQEQAAQESEKEERGGQKEAAGKESEKPKTPAGFYGMFTALMSKHHAHPISTHFPNGVLPVTVLFLVLSLVLTGLGLETAAFYNLVVAALSMPLVLFSGYVDWRLRYKGYMSPVFKKKIGSAAVAAVLVWGLTIWRIVDTDVAAAGEAARWIYLLVHLVMVGAVGYAGYLGGRLVFKE